MVLLKLAQLPKPTHVNKSGYVYFVVSHLTASCHQVFTIRLCCYFKISCFELYSRNYCDTKYEGSL